MKKVKKMIIGVDNGNANTKTVHSVFVSGITEHELKPPIGDEILKYDGKYYTLSANRNPYERDKTETINCFILTLFGIAKEIISENVFDNIVEVDLAVGLPPEHYALQMEKFKKYFKSRGEIISFVYNNRTFTLKIKSVNVFPQAYAAVAQKSSELKKFSRTYIIDIGGYTIDVLLLSKGKPDLTYCRSIENGIIKMNNIIKGRISATYGNCIDEEHIYDVLTGVETCLSQEVENSIKEEAKKHAKIILDELRELGIDLKSNPAIFVGGGALLLQPSIEESNMISKVEFLPDISANAVGYVILTGALIRKNKAS